MESDSSGDWVRTDRPQSAADRLDAQVLLHGIRKKMFGRGNAATAGRFELRRRLGRGAFGSVYLAYDPTLERKVAVKLLDEAIAGPEHRTRLLKEAQALARLEHPNVLTVYDVTVVSGQILIAMELVEGGTLADWCRDHPVGTRARFDALLDIAIGVGRGLAAAHDAGITHRDIKPANILVGDGRPRVADFGIAHAAYADASAVKAQDSSVPFVPLALDDDLGDTNLTHSRTVAGTPAFMAPEQFQGRAAPASDQWGLCATLWSCAYGMPAFSGGSVLERVAALEGKPDDPPRRDHGVPAWFAEILERGLARDPADRWPSVAALCAALEQATARQRRRRWHAAVAMMGVAAVVGLAAWGAMRLDLQRRLAACDEQSTAIDTTWNAEQQATLRASFAATGAGHAETSANKVSELLDERASAWRRVRAAACRDEVSKAWDADTLDRAHWCLDDRHRQLEALVTRLQQADVTAVTKAATAVTRLRDVEPCRDPVALARLPMPTEGRAEVAAVVAELEKASAYEAVGAYVEGLEVARAQLEPAVATGWQPLVASAQGQVGSLLTRSGALSEAESMLEAAYFTAVEAGANEEALRAAQMLVYVVGTAQSRYDEARRWWEHAETMRTQLPDDAGLREAATLSNRGRIEYAQGNLAEAAALHERALALREQALGSEHPRVASSLADLANVRLAMGAYEDAKALALRALELRRAALGEDHPYVAASLNNLAEMHKTTGAIDEAGRLHDEALRIREAALGADHPDVAQSLNNVGNVRFAQGALEEATSLHRRALRIREAALGSEHPEVAQSLSNLADLLTARGAYDNAIERYERALRILEGALGTEHLSVAHTVNNLGIVHYAEGRLDQAKRSYERTLAIRESALGSEHPLVAQSLSNVAVVAYETCALPQAEKKFTRALAILEDVLGDEHSDLAYPLIGLANVASAQTRFEDAVRFARRAVQVRERGEVPPAVLAEARLVLARALLRSGGDRDVAIELATQARDALRSAGAGQAELLGEAQAWLDAVKSGMTPPPRSCG